MDRNDSEQLVIRTRMPYQVTVSLVNENWWGVNRDYRNMDDAWIYGPQFGMNYMYLSSKRVWDQKELSKTLGDKAVTFYLYDDGCKPWAGAIFRRNYYNRYNNIQTLETRLCLIKEDAFISKQLIK